MLLSFIALLILIIYLPSSDILSYSEDSGSVSDTEDIRIQKVRNWKAQLFVGTINENSAIFADSLAEAYFSNLEYDSSAKYFEIAVELDPTPERIERLQICKGILDVQ